MDIKNHLRDAIRETYSDVWEVGFCDDGATVTISVDPNASRLCLIELSRMVAEIYRSTYYTIDVRYKWAPHRMKVLFGR